MRHTLLTPCLILAIVSSLGMGCVVKDTSSVEQAAIAAAEKWLDFVDNERYEASWDEAATLLKSAVKKSDWDAKIRAARSPLGTVVSRELTSFQYHTDLPGAPDGEYVVIEFKTRFEYKSMAIETITPMLDADSFWRVSGYYIR